MLVALIVPLLTLGIPLIPLLAALLLPILIRVLALLLLALWVLVPLAALLLILSGFLALAALSALVLLIRHCRSPWLGVDSTIQPWAGSRAKRHGHSGKPCLHMIKPSCFTIAVAETRDAKSWWGEFWTKAVCCGRSPPLCC
jgi:hypothetical protein